MQKFTFALFALSAIAASGFQTKDPTNSDDLRKLADQYFDQVYFRYQPTLGTIAGFHQYDSHLENYTRAEVEAQIVDLHAWDKKLLAIVPGTLDESARVDRQLLLNNIHSTLLTLETIRPWEKNPDIYSTGITSSAFTLMERKFAPADSRLRSLIEREKQMPAIFESARKNLRGCARISTEIAIEQLPGDIHFFESDVPEAFRDAQDTGLKGEFSRTNAAVIAALTKYQEWLQKEMLPKSNGDFRIGAATYSKKLLYDEMVDTPLDQLLRVAYDDLHKNQAAFETVAKEANPGAAAAKTLQVLGANHPPPERLLESFRNTFDSLVTFIQKKQIITIPSDVRPVVEETPPFMRATTQASMDPPGPFENNSKTAYFNVTLPEKAWERERTENYMHAFNIGTIVSTSVHEAYPGHYTQLLWINRSNVSKTRKLLGAATNIEGWAHYCEQMMLEEGYGQPGAGARDQHEAKLIKLGQLQDALLRDARFIVGIKMHTGQMTIEQAIDYFAKEGYQSRAIGEVEAKRGTSDPTYLYYTLGKLEILKLRADIQKREGSQFSLKKFHDNFMKQGGMPIPLVRRALVGD